MTFLHQWRASLGELLCSACSSSLASSVVQETLDLKVRLHQTAVECKMRIYYTANGQDESNPELRLATRAGKMELSFSLEATRRVQQESQIINPLFTKVVLSRWLDIGIALFLRSIWTLPLSAHEHTKEFGNYPAILTEQPWSITHYLD